MVEILSKKVKAMADVWNVRLLPVQVDVVQMQT